MRDALEKKAKAKQARNAKTFRINNMMAKESVKYERLTKEAMRKAMKQEGVGAELTL